jgi:hypothetical protein
MPAPKSSDANARLNSARLNLNVLRRHDSSISEIVDSTSYVALYQHTTEWHKTGVEGTLFLFKRLAWLACLPLSFLLALGTDRTIRTQAPLYGFYILNRQGIENVCEDLSEGSNLEVTPELIIYQSETSSEPLVLFSPSHYPSIDTDSCDLLLGRVHGIWVFEEEHRARIGRRMQECATTSPLTS